MLRTKTIDNIKHYALYDIYYHIFRDEIAHVGNKYTPHSKLFDYLVEHEFELKYKPRAYELLEWLKNN